MLVLASTSPYRAELLTRLGLLFTAKPPSCDETPKDSEEPAALAQRLARSKARSLRQACDQSLIIGSDQVASVDGTLIGKPGSRDNAIQQLLDTQGKAVHFFTAVCVLDTQSGREEQRLDTTVATLRPLTHEAIERYVDIDNPIDCAGSFKMEKLGICLFENIACNDPTALIGLPLIELCDCLRSFGYDLP